MCIPRPKRLFLVCLIVGVFCDIAGAGARAADSRPNVVFILSDDLGYGDLGCYGSPEIRTPVLDQMSRDGVRLLHCYSNGPVCTPTRAALMTGRYQQRVGLEWAIGPGVKDPGLMTKEVALPRMLKEAGYATGLIGKWHLGYQPQFSPNAHGFDFFFGIKSGNVDHYSHRENNNEADLFLNDQPIERTGYMTDLITEEAIGFIDRHSARPFFLYVPFNTVHWPFQPPNQPDSVRTPETWLSGTHDDYVKMVEHMDQAIGKILQSLDEHGLRDNTLVIFTSDNGGERHSRMAPLSQGKGTLWEGGIRVPGIVRWPAQFKGNQESSQPVITMDFTASILAAAEVSPPKNRKLDGVNLLPILAAQHSPVERTLFWRIDRADRKQQAVRQGKWKYLGDGANDLLFDLEQDVGEKQNLAATHADLLAQLKKLSADWNDEMDAEHPMFSVK